MSDDDSINNQYSCNVCNKEFKYKSWLQQHMKNKKCINGIKKDISDQYKCEKCNSVFVHNKNLQRHIKNNSCKQIKYKHKELASINVQNTSEEVLIVNGDRNIVSNDTYNININLSIPGLIRPLGLEDVTFLDKKEMIEILLSDNPELELLSRLPKNKENMNYFKYSIKEPFINYLDSSDSIKAIQEKKFEQKYYMNAHILLNVLFYLCKDDMNIFKCDIIANKLYNKSINNFYINQSSSFIPEEIINDLKAVINMLIRTKVNKDLTNFISKINDDINFKNLVSEKLDETNNLIKDVNEDMKSFYKKGIDKKDYKFMKDKEVVIKPKTEDDTGDELDELIEIHNKDKNDKEFEERVLNEIKRYEFRDIHRTLKNIKDHVERINKNMIDIKVLEEAKKRYLKIKIDEAKEYKKQLIKNLEKSIEDIESRDHDIDEELHFIESMN